MQIHFTLNHKKTAAEIAPDTLLIDLVRSLGCKSVKRGCEKTDPNEEEIREYLAGNLCRCSGYEGQLRGIQNFLAWKKSKEAAQ